MVEPKIPKSWGTNQQFIGLLKVGAFHKARGDRVEYVKGCKRARRRPDLVCVSSMFTYWYKPVWEAVAFYKKRYPKAHLQLGGIYATLCPEHAAKSGADEVVVGPHPRARDFPPDPTLLKPKPKFVYCMTSYGCSGNCTFCATHILYGRGIRQRPVEDVVSEIELQQERGFKKIYFGDDNLGHKAEEHLMPILEELIARQVKVDLFLYGGMQAQNVTLELAKLMKKARFRKVSLAIESVNSRVLKLMGKSRLGGVPVLETAVKNFVDAGFEKSDITTYFIIGLPYQRLDDMVETLVYLVRLGVWAAPQRFTPIPGTVDFKRLRLEECDLEDLYYKTFVAPGQTEFTHEDLEDIYKIARFFNIGRLWTRYDLLRGASRAHQVFLERFTSIAREGL